ncbi:acetyl/propionyl/methylcrotonyl-CoA carboxylase subunit alpha [Aquisalimonas lutea]|uniref:acetyl/propionyl/methylcrotonyl-CoA carboxylase subunit alpha n=1 Tax=Aquisalimonas lutea TaxID=1327750 RepID=UPI0025B61124|nr:acetyl/propionyl/methylcrotonyl-CoA carboxylase subunit alpha [Aquisalimonas lutea]MDN3518729.1 acetyl/propionyl/methylcrotonyl-CoA carboxylase subunit alpha [Aquisalimonas lutea]
MFGTVLIANRGEIACRIARTCRALGVRTVAVYSEADADAAHVHACDEAWPVGPAPARESYLNTERILEVARRSGAEAIHPGYGFLSENAEFAEACAGAGIRFIGPPASAIRAMGSKSAAKTIMAEAGVPLVPGYHGDDQSPEHLESVAAEIGYPVLIKASAGGGGKGMRRVDDPAEFREALDGARREARGSFGDDTVLLEKYLLQPRHVEVQVFADGHGNAVHLFERDCSVQRRHQKVIEEAPAPGLSDAHRQSMGEKAVAAARAIGYEGAGTVEFIMDAEGAFFFMEMNTRLQVEHPVTEMITGEDLVAWQLRVAHGEPLPRSQEAISHTGHAFEARIYAEDPDRDFLPAIGTIARLRTPAEDAHVRIDTGIREGDTISVHYDPMIAKLVVWDNDRPAALRRLCRALDDWTVAGTVTNTEFLGRVAAHPAFAAGGVDTGFIETYRDDLFPVPEAPSDRLLAVAALFELLGVDQAAAERARQSGDPWSPWHSTDGWQPNSDNHHVLHFLDGERDLTVVAHYRRDCFLLDLPGGTMQANGTLHADGSLRVVLDGVHLDARALQTGERLRVGVSGEERELVVHDPLSAGMAEELREGSLTAPMPGTVLSVLVSEGDHVEEGAALMVLEAMKMEHTIRAFTAGRVEHVNFRQGDQVSEGAELLAIGAEE